MGYSVGEAIGEGLKATGGNAAGDALRDALNGFKDVPLAVGPTTFTPEVHIPTLRSMDILEYTAGKPAYVETVTPTVDVGTGL